MIRNHSDNFRHFPPFSAIFRHFWRVSATGLSFSIDCKNADFRTRDWNCVGRDASALRRRPMQRRTHRRWLPPAAVSVVLAPSHISDHFRPSLEGLLRIKISYGPAVIHSCSGGLAWWADARWHARAPAARSTVHSIRPLCWESIDIFSLNRIGNSPRQRLVNCESAQMEIRCGSSEMAPIGACGCPAPVELFSCWLIGRPMNDVFVGRNSSQRATDAFRYIYSQVPAI